MIIMLSFKECPKDVSLIDVEFTTTTFTTQIHGFPLVYLCEGTSKLLRSKLRSVQ